MNFLLSSTKSLTKQQQKNNHLVKILAGDLLGVPEKDDTTGPNIIIRLVPKSCRPESCVCISTKNIMNKKTYKTSNAPNDAFVGMTTGLLLLYAT
mmetsp:Transcript_13673/g.20414  ORF Transcript_13673/g.20414 Transcript_13673/m.20414 type:complete len:95 (+) Transcript_13673:35-319(+)